MASILNLISVIALLAVLPPVAYLYLLAIASMIRPAALAKRPPKNKFAIVIPAHNEAGVIRNTVTRLRQLDYPEDLFAVHVIADHCTDDTAHLAGSSGAIVHEREEPPSRSKGAALAWLFKRLELEARGVYDAVVVFDADTIVDPEFLTVVDARLQDGAQVIQGRHCISNPQDGLYPALVSALFMIDNRFQNQGRANLGWSAKNMGDSICIRSEILGRLGWGAGLTEDYEFRHQLLLRGITIAYEPRAVGYGEAAPTWSAARDQRMRWLRGTQQASAEYGLAMLKEGIARRQGALIDGAAQALLPSYSTLTILALALLAFHVALWPFSSPLLIAIWSTLVFALGIYPLIGLVIEGAGGDAYRAILLGPFYILWRTWLRLMGNLGAPVVWVRTVRRGDIRSDATRR